MAGSSLLAIPPPGTSIDSEPYRRYLLAIQRAVTSDVAPIDARYWVSTANADLTNEQNIGALSSGYLKITTTIGVATPSTVASIPGADITGAALATVNDTNITATLSGTPLSALLRSVTITMGWLGVLSLSRGGTNANLSATGGTGQVLKQTSAGGSVTVAQVAASEIASGQALTKTDDTNVTLTLGGTPSAALLAATSLTLGWTGQLSAARGGTGVSNATQTYTPTLTNVANLGASTAYPCQYYRIGNVVTVSGKVDVDPTLTATSTQLGISLPIASNFGNDYECGGTAFAPGIAGQGAAILADQTNDRAVMQWVSTDITNQAMFFTFTYQVI